MGQKVSSTPLELMGLPTSMGINWIKQKPCLLLPLLIMQTLIYSLSFICRIKNVAISIQSALPCSLSFFMQKHTTTISGISRSGVEEVRMYTPVPPSFFVFRCCSVLSPTQARVPKRWKKYLARIFKAIMYDE